MGATPEPSEWHWRSYDVVDPNDAKKRVATVACGIPWSSKISIAPTMNNVTCSDCNAWLADFLVQRSAGAAPLEPPTTSTTLGLLIGEHVAHSAPAPVQAIMKGFEGRAMDVRTIVAADGVSVLIRVRGRQLRPNDPEPAPLPRRGVVSAETVTLIVQAVLRERRHPVGGFGVRLRSLGQGGVLIDVEGASVHGREADEVAGDISDRCHAIVAGQVPIATMVAGTGGERRCYIEPRRQAVAPPVEDEFGE